MGDDSLDHLLDTIRDDQLEVASRLSQALQEKQAWRDLEHELKLLAVQFGKEAAQDALPLLVAGLKIAIAAA